MVIVLEDGESIQGTIEWYDRTCIKVNRNAQPNMLVYKASIKYMFKQGEER
jgi:sRNA-binding regulator protein Hfq